MLSGFQNIAESLSHFLRTDELQNFSGNVVNNPIFQNGSKSVGWGNLYKQASRVISTQCHATAYGFILLLNVQISHFQYVP